MFWRALILFGMFNAAQSATFRCYKGSFNNYFETPLNDPSPLLSSCIDKSRNTTIYAAGASNKADGPAITRMITTYIALNNTNVILINWEKESSLLPNVLSYAPAIAAAKEIASTAGASIVTLIQNGVLPSRIRLVGHSLGAHLMGWVGKKVQESNYLLLSIWGLDAAGPGFDGVIHLQGLNPSQAQYVNTILTNPGKLGTDKPFGRINFWVNCGNDGLQPGCPAGIYPPFSEQGLCSHDRAWMIMSEALLNPGSFPALLSTSCTEWKSQNSANGVINYIGEDYDPNKPGDFYLSTNAQSPFSKGQAGLTPNE